MPKSFPEIYIYIYIHAFPCPKLYVWEFFSLLEEREGRRVSDIVVINQYCVLQGSRVKTSHPV